MAVGVGDQGKAVEGRDRPVHRRIRGETGLQGKDVLAEVVETLLDGVEAGTGTEQREPRRPDVGGDEKAFRGCGEDDFKEIAGVETKDGAAVRFDIADGGETGIDPLGGRKVGDIKEIMDLAGGACALVDGAHLR